MECGSPKECSSEELAEFLTDYFNKFEKKIKDNIKQVNDNFLVNVFDDMEAIGNEFWNIDEITIHGLANKVSYDTVYKSHVASDWSDGYNGTANNGSAEKPDAEAALREAFPMFDFNAFLCNIESEYLALSDGHVSFQCSDKFEAQILCGAYDCLDESLTFTDWHNF